MISVFTPLSETGNKYIQAAWETLKSQTHRDFEWVVLENHGGKLPKKIRRDKRVHVYGDISTEGIGALKKKCCELAKGEWLFEFDHDDLLHETALEKALAALQEADFVYSDCAEFQDETWLPNIYRADCGWTTYPVRFQDHPLLAQPSPPVTPQNIRLIDWAPNHLRAFRRSAYERVGGHSSDLPVADDHDLILKMYLSGCSLKHIPECLYFYRVHPRQTVSTRNAMIRAFTERLYDQNIFALAERFCSHALAGGEEVKRMDPLQKIDLCGAIDTQEGYRPLDLSLGHDLDGPWPLADDSVGVIRAYDAIEHLKSHVHTMNEAHRVLAPGGFLLIRVPSTDGPAIAVPQPNGQEPIWVPTTGRGAWQDPTHVSFWNENSFWYYTRSSHARYVPGLTARFQCTRLRTFYPNSGCEAARIPYVEAHLIALKEGYSPMGLVEM